MSGLSRALNSLREQRRNAQRGLEKAVRAGNDIEAQKCRRTIRRLDEEIENLEDSR